MDSHSHARTSRRSVAKATLWTTPVIALGAPAPAIAASQACSSAASPSVSTRTYSPSQTSTITQVFSGIVNNCSTAVVTGIAFNVKWCNTGSQTVTVQNNSTPAQLSQTAGPSGAYSLAPGACVTWSFVSIASLPASSGYSVVLRASRPSTIQSTVQITGMPSGTTNRDPAGGTSVYNLPT